MLDKIKQININIVFFVVLIIVFWLLFVIDLKKYFITDSIGFFLNEIDGSLQDYYNKNWKYPDINNWFSIYSSGLLIGYQWLVDETLRKSLKIKSRYRKNIIYNVNYSNDRYQLTYIDSKIIITEWDSLGMIMEKNNPILSYKDWFNIDSNNITFKVLLKSDRIVESNKDNIKFLKGTYYYEPSCKKYLEKNPSLQWSDGLQTIHPLYFTWDSFDVFCDMSTEDWWWTVTSMIANNKTPNLFYTYNNLKVLDLKKNISTKWRIDDVWTDKRDKDLMIKCFVNNSSFKDYEKPLIIYGYNWKDIKNLTKIEIAWTKFSSKKLNAKCWDKRFLLSEVYWSSSSIHTMRIFSVNNENLYYLNKWYELKCRTKIWKNNICIESSELQFNTQNYCITAIR